MNSFKYLKNRQIYDILIGDSHFDPVWEELNKYNIKIGMPYMTGHDLCEMLSRFGYDISYGKESRWMYMEYLIDHCNSKNKTSELLNHLFSKEHFKKNLWNIPVMDVDLAYNSIVSQIIDQINKILYFNDHELVRLGNQFWVKDKDKPIDVQPIQRNLIDYKYINDITERAMKDISEGNFDSAITKSRTMLEEVFCCVIEKKNQVPSAKGNIFKLYGQVKELYGMNQGSENDRRINTLLSGLEKILSSVSEMRNATGDAHGLGSRRISIKEHHARLYLNSAKTMSGFILEMSSQNEKTNFNTF